jgi:RNA-binding protein NOB1
LEDDDDDEGWITPKNFAQKRLEMYGAEGSKKQEEVKVACMTTDFAMQVS